VVLADSAEAVQDLAVVLEDLEERGEFNPTLSTMLARFVKARPALVPKADCILLLIHLRMRCMRWIYPLMHARVLLPFKTVMMW